MINQKEEVIKGIMTEVNTQEILLMEKKKTIMENLDGKMGKFIKEISETVLWMAKGS